MLILQQIQTEMLMRRNADDQIMVLVTDLDNRVRDLEAERFSLADLQNSINSVALRTDDNEMRIEKLERSIGIDTYSRTQIDSLLVPWRVEEISNVFDTPTMEMFDDANMSDLKTGYVHYLNGDIHDPFSLEFSPNTMRRYSLSAYTPIPKEVEFLISYADRCVVLLNNEEIITYQEDGGNFNGTQKALKIDLNTGWNDIVFLVANEMQHGGLVVSSNLLQSVEKLSPMSALKGRITGDQIQVGTLTEDHFSQNMELMIKRIHATTSSEPAGVYGDPEGYGAIQIADGVISKTKGEPFRVHGDLQVIGYIRDKDGKIIDGGGGGGLSTADREKLDSIEWRAEVNQNAFSYIRLANIPVDSTDPFANVINARAKMDTLLMRGDLGITFDIEQIKNQQNEDVDQLVIKNSPTEYKSKLFVSEDDQNTFAIDEADGAFQLGRGSVFVYIEGIKQAPGQFYEVDKHTIRLREKLGAGFSVLVEWQEGSPAFAKETLVSISTLPMASRTQDGIMGKHMVEDLYNHRHKSSEITELNVFDTIQIDDGVNELQTIEATHDDRRLRIKAGPNIKLEKINTELRISSLGPVIEEGYNIKVTGSPEKGYLITNRQKFEGTRGIVIDHLDGIDVIKGPHFVEGRGVDFQMISDDAYRVTNTMSLVSIGGIDVTGDGENGYVIRNTLKLIESGGINVDGDAVTGFKLRNAMSLRASAAGPVTIQGNAADGFMLTGLWPSITSGTGVAVDSFGDGKYLVKNTGVTSYNGQTGEVVGVGSLNKVAEGRGIRVQFHGNGDYVVHNTGVVSLIDDGVGGGIDVEDTGNQIWRIRNTGVIKNIAGQGISVSGNGQRESTITNTGVLSASSGRGILVSGSAGHITVHNTGIVVLVEGEGIDINTNAEGTATIRNTGVTSINGETGDVILDLTPATDPDPVERSIASVVEFFEAGERYKCWIRADQPGTTHYVSGVKHPEQKFFNVTVVAGMEGGGNATIGLYTGSASNYVATGNVTQNRNQLNGQTLTLSAPIDQVADYKVTGVHVGVRDTSGTINVRVLRAWLSIERGTEADYQV